MLFNSYIFICLFLPATLALFYWLSRVARIEIAMFSLAVASMIFYSWWNPEYLVLLVFSMLANYIIGSRLGHLVAQKRTTPAKLLFAGGIMFNLGLLGYYKYANLLVDSLNFATGTDFQLAPIVLPLAISFFTFTQIAYLADVHAGKAEEYDMVSYVLFVTFFPHLIAGPIVHHREMMPQFRSRNAGTSLVSNLATGSALFSLGLFKKVVLADNVAPFSTSVFDAAQAGAALSFSEAWLGTLAYSCQIYFDFSGYSDMAVGLGLLFGIQLPLNFNSPYKATGIIEFWRRWHMTLSRFLRDYLYIPLGGNQRGESRRYANMLIVMLLGGLWHGAGWNFLIWGGLHGLYLIVNHAWREFRGNKRSDSLPARLASGCLTFLAVTVAWVFFKAASFDAAFSIIKAMAGTGGVSLPQWLATAPLLGEITASLPLQIAEASLAPLDGAVWVVGLLLVAWLLPNTQQFMRNFLDPDRYSIMAPAWPRFFTWRPSASTAVMVTFLAAYAFLSLDNPSEFIYYQF